MWSKNLKEGAFNWFARQRKKLGPGHYPFWHLSYEGGAISQKLDSFASGSHRFGPLLAHAHTDNSISQYFSELNRLLIHLLYRKLKPTFKHIMAKSCVHLQGPSITRRAVMIIICALRSKQYTYFCRFDIRSFYASIDHGILVDQIKTTLDDLMMHRYLPTIITSAVDQDGVLFLPTCGMPICSSLSPFFAALYLRDLDRALETMPGVFYLRFVDDCILLCKTQRQYREAGKKLFRILRSLKPTLSAHKSCFGSLPKKTFHFLGVHFDATRIHQSLKQTQVLIRLHRRTYQRALDKVRALRYHAVDPATTQRYLNRWAAWWHIDGFDAQANIANLLACAKQSEPDLYAHLLSVLATGRALP